MMFGIDLHCDSTKLDGHGEPLLSGRAIFERSFVINGDWKSHATMQAK